MWRSQDTLLRFKIVSKRFGLDLSIVASFLGLFCTVAFCFGLDLSCGFSFVLDLSCGLKY